MENVVLFGNGLNLLSNNLSWHDLLDKILHNGLEDKDTSVCIPSALPNTLQYDFLLFNSDSVGKSIVEERQLNLKKCIAENVKHFATNDIYVGQSHAFPADTVNQFRRRSDTVAFLYAKFSRAFNHTHAVRVRAHKRDKRKFVNHRRNVFSSKFNRF